MTLFGCDCMITTDGKVQDENSSQALNEVSFYSLNKTYNKSKNDLNGSFSFSEINGGAGNCASIDIVFEKTGYKSDTITFKSGSKDVIVKLKK